MEELKKQRLFLPNNKGYMNLSSTQRRNTIEIIHQNLSLPLKQYCNNFGVKPKILILKTAKDNHIIDFETNFHRRNVGDVEINKFASYDKMNDKQRNELKMTLSEIQNNKISHQAHSVK